MILIFKELKCTYKYKGFKMLVFKETLFYAKPHFERLLKWTVLTRKIRFSLTIYGQSTCPTGIWTQNLWHTARAQSTLTIELPSPHGRPVAISPCLIRFVPKSAGNHAETDELVPLVLAAWERILTEQPNVTGRKSAWPDRNSMVQALWSLSYGVTRSTCDSSINCFDYFLQYREDINAN